MDCTEHDLMPRVESASERLARAKNLIKMYMEFNIFSAESLDHQIQSAVIEDCPAVIETLMAHPEIDVNLHSLKVHGMTTFHTVCLQGNVEMVKMLLRDSRVQINKPSTRGYTPLTEASFQGHIETIKWMIASGRELDLGTPGTNSDPFGSALRSGNLECWSLLKAFSDDPAGTRARVRAELGIEDFEVVTPRAMTTKQYYDYLRDGLRPEKRAAGFFALGVLLDDGFLKVRRGFLKVRRGDAKAEAFFAIASRLPLELKMVLCKRAAGDPGNVVLSKDSEPYFRQFLQ